jgi:UrcA family protein
MNTTIQNTLRAASFFLCGALTLGALQASARAADLGVPSEKVRFSDLDVSKPAGAKVLYGRIVAAATRVCTVNGSRDLGTAQHTRICTAHAINNAINDVGSPALSALRPNSVIHFASN